MPLTIIWFAYHRNSIFANAKCEEICVHSMFVWCPTFIFISTHKIWHVLPILLPVFFVFFSIAKLKDLQHFNHIPSKKNGQNIRSALSDYPALSIMQTLIEGAGQSDRFGRKFCPHFLLEISLFLTTTVRCAELHHCLYYGSARHCDPQPHPLIIITYLWISLFVFEVLVLQSLHYECSCGY